MAIYNDLATQRKDYSDISNFLKIELVRDFDFNKASKYEGYIEGQAINFLLADDIEAPIEAIKGEDLKAKVKAHKADIVKRVHEILASDPDFRKLIVYHLRRKGSIMRVNFTDDKSFLASPQWQRVAQVIAPYNKEFDENWSPEEYKRLLTIFAKKRGKEEIIAK